MDEKQFSGVLNELKDLASLQGGFVSELQMEEYLPEITKEQKKLIYDYFRQSGIGINEPMENADASDAGHLKFYLEEIEDIELPDDDMKKLYLREAIRGDIQAKEKVVKIYLSSVVDIAKLYAGQGVELEDLIGEGNVALAAAIEHMECIDTPEDADALVAKMIMNAMEAYIGIENDEEQGMRQVMAETVKVLEKAKQMAEELLRKVTLEELCKEGGFSREDIMRAAEFAKECADYIDLT